MKCYTIGHSNNSLDYFLELLRRNGIDTVVDVRRVPYSRYARQFNREILQTALKSGGIRYLFMGNFLGGKITDPAYLTRNGRINDSKVMKSPRFLEGIAQLEAEIKTGATLALMCAEKDPLRCHRFFLISRFLARKGYKIFHIVDDKTLVHEELERKAKNRFLEQFS